MESLRIQRKSGKLEQSQLLHFSPFALFSLLIRFPFPLFALFPFGEKGQKGPPIGYRLPFFFTVRIERARSRLLL